MHLQVAVLHANVRGVLVDARREALDRWSREFRIYLPNPPHLPYLPSEFATERPILQRGEERVHLRQRGTLRGF
jgi:hypothetical protein